MWDLERSAKPMATIGAPNMEHMSSPVTEGDHTMRPAGHKEKDLMCIDIVIDTFGILTTFSVILVVKLCLKS